MIKCSDALSSRCTEAKSQTQWSTILAGYPWSIMANHFLLVSQRRINDLVAIAPETLNWVGTWHTYWQRMSPEALARAIQSEVEFCMWHAITQHQLVHQVVRSAAAHQHHTPLPAPTHDALVLPFQCRPAPPLQRNRV